MRLIRFDNCNGTNESVFINPDQICSVFARPNEWYNGYTNWTCIVVTNKVIDVPFPLVDTLDILGLHY